MKPFAHEINFVCPTIIAKIFHEKPYFIWLDTPQKDHILWPKNTAQFSFIAFEPAQIFANSSFFNLQVFEELNECFKKYPLENDPNLPRWQGGIAGYLGYEVNQLIESVPTSESDFIKSPTAVLGIYDIVIAFDHVKNRAWIISTGYPHQNEEIRKAFAHDRIQAILQQIENYSPPSCDSEEVSIQNLNSTVSEQQYTESVQKVIDYIYAGDIFQANLSRQFQANISENSSKFFLYNHLRSVNPAPFSAYFQCDPFFILSSSPERFISVSPDHLVSTRPIKGTRKRDLNDDVHDDQLKNDLLTSPKDKAENLMIVDLMRNDLSKSCLLGTVKVDALWQLETYATVHQLTSVVSGTLDHTQFTPIDLLVSCFPGGSITGAPKVRAMEIIAELEQYKRGPYCGSIGYIGFNGCMDFNIAIRTIVVNEDRLAFNVGGGIVADSDPLDEYKETETKSFALIKALKAFEK